MTHHGRQGYRRHVWRDMGVLGSGSFGEVKLFENQENGDKIALKEMKIEELNNLSREERDQMIMRIKVEIKIMWEHDNENLVKALCVPQDMHYSPPNNVLHVWMEYCDGGDLRNSVLLKCSNCCGVEEKQLRAICTDMNKGIRFLHQYEIIHRDLKPENVLIKYIDKDRVIYKLTDFGFAKSCALSATIAKSYVGTPQYVAPEIIENDSHDSAVDLWSFGLIVFELITGIRPFLHKSDNSRNPLDWVGPVGMKGDKCIYITYGQKVGSLHFSDEIPQPYHISSVTAEKLTGWLRKVLRCSPERRGGVPHGSKEEVPSLIKMDGILKTKVLNVFCMSKGNEMCYELQENDSIESLYGWLQQHYDYTRGMLHLLTDDGIVLHQLNFPTDITFECNTGNVYLYSEDLVPSFKLVTDALLPTVQKLITVDDDGLNKHERQQHFAHAYMHLRKQEKLFEKLCNGHRSILCLIKSLCDELKRNELYARCNKILGATEAIKQIQEVNLQKCGTNNVTYDTDQFYRQLTTYSHTLDGHLKSLTDMMGSVRVIQNDINATLTKSEVMLQCHMSSQECVSRFHNECIEKALMILEDEKNKKEHSKMSALLSEASMFAERLIQDHFNKINFLQVYLELLSHIDNVKSFNETLLHIEDDCKKINSTMIDDIWSLISHTSPDFFIGTNNNVDVSQSFPISSIENDKAPYIRRSSSAANILSRLRSQSSFSSEPDDDSQPDIQWLLGSLKNEITNMSQMNAKSIEQNRKILRSHSVSTAAESDSDNN